METFDLQAVKNQALEAKKEEEDYGGMFGIVELHHSVVLGMIAQIERLLDYLDSAGEQLAGEDI